MDYTKILESLLQYGALGVVAFFYIKNNNIQTEKQQALFEKMVNNVLKSNDASIKAKEDLERRFDIMIEAFEVNSKVISKSMESLMSGIRSGFNNLDSSIHSEKKFNFDEFEAISNKILKNAISDIQEKMEDKIKKNHLFEQNTINCGIRPDRCDGSIYNAVKSSFNVSRVEINTFNFSDRLKTNLFALINKILKDMVEDLCKMMTVTTEIYDKEYMRTQLKEIISRYRNKIDELFLVLKGDEEL